MVDLEAWYEIEQDGAVIVSTPAELDAILDTVAGWDGRRLVDFYVVGATRPALFNVGLHGKAGRGALVYSAGSEGWISTETPESGWSTDEPILYYLMMSDTEFPANCEVSLDVARQAAHEFMATGGERPTATAWRTADDWLW